MAYRAESILEGSVTSSLDFFLRVTISVLLLTPATSGSQVWRPWILLPVGGKVPPGVYVCVPEHSGVLCVYLSIQVCVCVYLSIQGCVCVYLSIQGCVCVCVYLSIQGCVCVCVCT